MVKKQLTKKYEAPAFTESRIVAARTLLAESAEAVFDATSPVAVYTTANTHDWF